MKNVLFIRTYLKDLPWLELTLQTLFRHAKGWDEIMIAFPFEDLYPVTHRISPLLNGSPIPVKMQPVARMTDDYIGQQATKCHADTWAGTDTLITFWDSDAALTDTLNLHDLFRLPHQVPPRGEMGPGPKPAWLYTPYEALTADRNVMAWKPITERYLGEPVSHEFMRRLPITVYGAHLAAMRLFVQQRHNTPLQALLFRASEAGRKEFSEFNLMGAFCHNNFPNDYVWVDTTRDAFNALPVKQYWSWGGLQQNHIEEITGFIHTPKPVFKEDPTPQVETPRPVLMMEPEVVPPSPIDPPPEVDGDHREVRDQGF